MPLTVRGQICLEKTPAYFVRKEVPPRIHDMCAYTKLLVVVRDPVTRAISGNQSPVSTALNYSSHLISFRSLTSENGEAKQKQLPSNRPKNSS